MAWHAKNSEHSGAKHGSTASFDGTKQIAKESSKRHRRAADRAAARTGLEGHGDEGRDQAPD